jgi:hypothetical protein
VGGGVILAVLLFSASMVTCALTIGIWPGEAKLTAPLFCPDGKPDPFVVVDSYSTSPGETSYNFSLYCMGSRGDVHEVGFLWPCVVLTAAHAALILLAVGLFAVLRRLRRSRRAADDPTRPVSPIS